MNLEIHLFFIVQTFGGFDDSLSGHYLFSGIRRMEDLIKVIEKKRKWTEKVVLAVSGRNVGYPAGPRGTAVRSRICAVSGRKAVNVLLYNNI